jgi:hypothetical protein
VADLAGCQQRLRREGELLAGLHIGFHGRTHRLQSIVARIFAGQHRKHAGHGTGACRIDAPDLCVGMWRAQHRRMSQALEVQIVQICALAGGKARVLPSLRSIADDRTVDHSPTSPCHDILSCESRQIILCAVALRRP